MSQDWRVKLVRKLRKWASDRFPLTFAKASIQAMRDLRDDYPVLIGDVDDRYGASCRWLAWLGGSVGAPRAAGPFAQPFRQFSFVRA